MESESPARGKDAWTSRLFRWVATDQAKRYSLPGLVAYYWTSGTPKACSVGNISSSGMYVVDDEAWLPGSVIPMTLQRDGDAGQDAEDWIAVMTQVVRSGPDGHGLAFSFSGSTQLFRDEIPPDRLADNKTLKRFIKHMNRS